jgi:hypothetical protein
MSLLPVFYFFVDNEKTQRVSQRCENYGYHVTFERPNLMKYHTFFYVTHDLVVHASFREIIDTSHFICVILYHFCIDDLKDQTTLEGFFNSFLRGDDYYGFTRGQGLLKYYIDPKLAK